MNSWIKVLLFANFFSYVRNEYNSPDYPLMPEKCQPNTEIMYPQCCVFPPFFIRDVARECGAIFKLNFINKETKVAGLQRTALTGCAYWECLLKKYYLLNEDGDLDEEKYFLHLDKWVDLNQAFSSVLLSAKIHCKQIYRMSMPFSPCEFNEFQTCIRSFVIVNCPTIVPTPECARQKQFYEECKDFYI